jgi:hypothetical protein
MINGFLRWFSYIWQIVLNDSIPKHLSMKKNSIAFAAVCLFFTTQTAFCQEAFKSDKLQKVWESQPGLLTPESACYNPADGLIYVSNIARHPDGVNGPGFLSKMNDQGEVLVKEWVTGFKSPKGIGIVNGNLYVADVDKVWEIALKTGEVLKKYGCSLARGLNDVAVDREGRVYVTETKKNLLLTVGKDSLEVFSASEQLGALNGVCEFGTEMLLGAKNRLIAIDKKTKSMRILADSTGYLDGIVVVGKNKVITSDWKGLVQLIEPLKSIEKLMDTTSLGIYAADLGLIPSQNILLVPTFFDNKVVAYKLNF